MKTSGEGVPLAVMCRQSPRAVGSDPLIAPPFKHPGGIWGCLPTARQSVLLQKNLRFQGFQDVDRP